MIYISGAITSIGVEKAEKLFNQAEEYLKEIGYTKIVNPMKLVPYSPDLTWSDYMREDIKALMECDTLYALKGWEKSKGARIEISLANKIGIKLIFE